MFVVWDKVEKYAFYQVNKLQLYRKKCISEVLI